MEGKSNLSTFILLKFGRCPGCMRIALWAAIGAWSLAGISNFMDSAGPVRNGVISIAAVLTIASLVHIFTYGWRKASFIAVSPHLSAVDPRRPSKRVITARTKSLSRRELVGIFLKSSLAAFAASLALTRIARAACGDCAEQFGAGWHDCITYSCNTIGQHCCPPGYPYLNHCDCLCYDGTDFDCGSYSNCNYCS